MGDPGPRGMMGDPGTPGLPGIKGKKEAPPPMRANCGAFPALSDTDLAHGSFPFPTDAR